MPFYEYECANCKYYTEIMQKVSDAPLRKCPSCGKSTLKKLVSAPVFRLKGAGWYETDFKSDKEGKRNLAEKEKEPQPEKKEAVKEEAKGAEAKAAEPASDAKAPETKASESKSAEKSTADAAGSSASRRRMTGRRAVAKAPSPKSRPKSRSAPRKHR